MNHLFHVPDRWRLLRPLGQGAYGLVVSVQDTVSGEPVAIKCITRVFDKPILARRALREITLLRHFGEHENLTGLIDLDNVWDGYNEIYLYMEPMEADLHQIVRSGQPLSNLHIQFFLYQLLRGVKYIHSANVIHRDLKPGNLLVNSDCELKICDFGLARGYQPVTGEAPQNEELRMTECEYDLHACLLRSTAQCLRFRGTDCSRLRNKTLTVHRCCNPLVPCARDYAVQQAVHVGD